MNKIYTDKGQIQFVSSDGRVLNVDASNIYTRFTEDTVSFMLIALPVSSGLAIFTSRAEDLQVDGVTYSIDQLEDVLAKKFAAAAVGGSTIKLVVVDELPDEGEENTIYLVEKEGSDTDSYYEYLYVNGKWELIGSTDVKLDDYYTKEESDERFALKGDSLFQSNQNVNSLISIKGSTNTFDSFYKNLLIFGNSNTGYTSNAIVVGSGNNANGLYSNILGQNLKNGTNSVALGYFNDYSSNSNPNWGSAKDSIFTVGNGANNTNRHNVLDIRHNGDFYIADTNAEGNYYQKPMINLQDKLKELEENQGGDSPWEAGTGANSAVLKGGGDTVEGKYSVAIGNNNIIKGSNLISTADYSVAIGRNNTINGSHALAVGYYNTVYNNSSIALGNGLTVNNLNEVAVGISNVSIAANTSKGIAGTRFTVGNGSYAVGGNKNAFQVMDNFDIYYVDNKQDDLPMVKLQDKMNEIDNKQVQLRVEGTSLIID